MTTPANWRTARLSTGAHSINHGHSVGKEAPYIIYTDPRPFVFVEGDEVVVVDETHPRHNQRGIVTARRVGFPNTYSVKFPDGIASIISFKERQLAKVEKKTAAIHPYATRGKTGRARKSTTVYVDTFAWGDVTLPLIAASTLVSRAAQHLKRQRAKECKLPDVIQLPATVEVSEKPIDPPKYSIAGIVGNPRQAAAHAKFLAFIEQVNRDIPLSDAKLTRRTWHSIIERRIETREQQRRKLERKIA